MSEPDETPDEFEPYAAIIPEGCAPLHGFRIVRYIDTNGVERSRWKVDGDCTTQMTIGDLFLAAVSYANDTLQDIEEF